MSSPQAQGRAPTPARSSLHITLSVWRALLLREALARLFGRRAALAWLLLEPLAHMGFMVFVYTVLRVRHVGGINSVLWVVTGLLAFFLFRRVGNQGASAIGANLALFTYRQVKPADTVFVRSALEALIMFMLSAAVLSGAAILGIRVYADNPLTLIGAVVGLWLLGLGWGLCVSVANELWPEIGNIVGMLLVPLYLISGVLVPLTAIPYPARSWILFNPVAHGVELVRSGVAAYYHLTPEISINYLFGSALVLVFFGLALQVRFRFRLAAL